MEHRTRSRATRVTIMGQEYVLSGEIDPEYLTKVAQYVNGKMKEIHERTVGMSMTRLAVLAAINLADEVLSLMTDNERAEILGSEQMDKLENRIGAWLHDSDIPRLDGVLIDQPA